MNDFEVLITNVLPGIVLSLPVYGMGWLLARRGWISDKVARWGFYSIGSGVFGFFVLGIVFFNLDLPVRLLITFAIWAMSMTIGFLLTRV